MKRLLFAGLEEAGRALWPRLASDGACQDRASAPALGLRAPPRGSCLKKKGKKAKGETSRG